MDKMRKITGFLLIALYLFYSASTTLFIHTHVFTWGTVTHSHPYNPFGDNGTPNHTHTAAECSFISHLNSQLPDFFACLTVAAAVFILLQVFVVYNYRILRQTPCIFFSLRAPPALVY